MDILVAIIQVIGIFSIGYMCIYMLSDMKGYKSLFAKILVIIKYRGYLRLENFMYRAPDLLYKYGKSHNTKTKYDRLDLKKNEYKILLDGLLYTIEGYGKESGTAAIHCVRMVKQKEGYIRDFEVIPIPECNARVDFLYNKSGDKLIGYLLDNKDIPEAKHEAN